MVQERNIRALETLLKVHPGQTILIGTHGTALSTIINYYKPDFQLTDFHRIKHIFPWIVKFEFLETSCLSIIEGKVDQT